MNSATDVVLVLLPVWCFLQRFVSPLVLWKSSRWAPNDTLCKTLDRCQRKMVGACLRLKKFAIETPKDFVKRRNRESSKHISPASRWSQKVCCLTGQWDSHIRRVRNNWAWSFHLLGWHNEEWLESRRVSGSSDYQNPATRAFGGRPCTRWHEGVEYAKKLLASRRAVPRPAPPPPSCPSPPPRCWVAQAPFVARGCFVPVALPALFPLPDSSPHSPTPFF